VLLATHSAIALNMVDLGDVLCFGRDPSGATDIVTGDEHPALKDWKRGEPDLGVGKVTVRTRPLRRSRIGNPINLRPSSTPPLKCSSASASLSGGLPLTLGKGAAYPA
jgi:hypothetical protein